MPPTGLAYLPHKHLLYAPQLRVVQAEEIASCRWNSNQCARGGSAEWRLHMGYDPHTCQFTDFELTDSRDAERLDRFAQTADEIRIADRGFGSRPECIRSLAFGEADYIVRVHWRGLRWLTAEGMRFDMMGFLRGLDCGKNGETTVMIGNSGNKKAGAPFPARLIAVSLPPEKALISKPDCSARIVEKDE
jgi:IS4 transposase